MSFYYIYIYIYTYIYIYIYQTWQIKTKLNLASTPTNNLITELPERRDKLKAQVQFRHDIL